MTLTIPDERIGNLTLDERDMMTDIAIGFYKREQVSLGRAAEIAGIISANVLQDQDATPLKRIVPQAGGLEAGSRW